jgi:hypothetical protein
VFLVWGINGWALVYEGIRPAETVAKDSLMYTHMAREGDIFDQGAGARWRDH